MQERETISVTTLQRETGVVPRVQVANKLHEGRARASHSVHASLQTADKQATLQ